MPTQNDNRSFTGRRTFLLSLFMYPFLISKLKTDEKIGEINPLSSNNEEEFVILGGWVLLKGDLIESPS